MIALVASACTDAAGPANAVQPLTLSVVEGSAYRLPAGARVAAPVSGEILFGRDDQVWAATDTGVTLRFPDSSLIRMEPNTGIRLHQPYAASTRPVIQLLSGEISVTSSSNDYLIETYREVPLSFRIVVVNMILDPKSSTSEFNLAFVGDTAEASVSQGGVEARAADLSGTLLANWRAVLAPGEALQIIPPFEYTPTISPFGTAVVKPTRTATYTPTFTPSPTPTATDTPLPSPTPTRIPPTNTREPKEPPPPPPPPPPPTEPPEPTEPPPPPTEVPTLPALLH